jgi:predicted nucleic acid-binding protein
VEIIDTDVLIDVQRGHPPAVAWFAGLKEMPAIPGFVVMELVQDARNQAEVEKALRLVAPFVVIWPTVADCQRALSDFINHRLANGLGLIDSLIAATAQGLTASLLTFNDKHYRPLSNVTTKRPYDR